MYLFSTYYKCYRYRGHVSDNLEIIIKYAIFFTVDTVELTDSQNVSINFLPTGNLGLPSTNGRSSDITSPGVFTEADQRNGREMGTQCVDFTYQ